MILISFSLKFPSLSATLIDNFPASLIESQDSIFFHLNLSDTVQFSVLLSLRDAITVSQSMSWLFEILIFSHPRIFISDFASISGGVVSGFLQPNKTIAASNTASSTRPDQYVLFLKKNVRQIISLNLTSAKTLQICTARIKDLNLGGTAHFVVPIDGRQPCRLASISLWSILRHTFHSPPLHSPFPNSPLVADDTLNADKR